MFKPPRCPNRTCPNHRDPVPSFYANHGSYRPACRPRSVPRFRCKHCKKTFSRQTFRMDYRDHRPSLNARLFESIASGIGLRQTSRNLGLSLPCTQLKFRKIARHLRGLNINLRGPLPKDVVLQLGELESHEAMSSTRPLKVPILMERERHFLIWAESAQVQPQGMLSGASLRAMQKDEARFGPRSDSSAAGTARALQRGADLVSELEEVVLVSNGDPTYAKLAQQAFGAARLVQCTTSTKPAQARPCSPAPMNFEKALMRDQVARLRKGSWLASKQPRYLDLGLQLWMAYRNYVRPRFHRDSESPAQMLGFVSRRLSCGEALSWRQDWGTSSIHPLSKMGVSVSAKRTIQAAT